jgi:hypothetical protein
MAYLPENSRILLDEKGKDDISKMGSTTEIMQFLHEQAIAQGHVVPEPPGFDQNILHETNAPTVRGYTKTVTIDGTKHTIEGATAEELTANEVALYRSLFSRDATGSQEPPAVQHEEPEVVDAQEQLRLADLETKFHAGAISLDQYINESGAVEKILAARGIDVGNLQTASDHAYVQSWTEATQEFINKTPSWPGGQKNLATVTALMQANPELMDADDKVAALEQCFEYMKAHELVDTSEVDQRRSITESMATGKSFDEIKSAALRSIGRDPATDYSVRDWHRGQ